MTGFHPRHCFAAELRQVLKRGETPNRDAILQAFCSTQNIPNASLCFWKVMEETLAPGGHT